MTNKFYTPGQQRAARVNELFDTIAPRYDLINDLQSFGFHRVWKRRLVRLATAEGRGRALDLCCGTGDITFALARRGLSVTGLDFSEPMLAVARQRLAHWSGPSGSNTGAVELLQGDAQKIPFPDNTFDVVTISYGLRNLADLDLGIREMVRVTKPGGRLLVLDFGKPDHPLWRAIYFGYLRRFVPVLGRLFCGDADTHGYILESLLHYAAQKGVASRMEQFGLTEVRILNLMGGIMSINSARKPA